MRIAPDFEYSLSTRETILEDVPIGSIFYDTYISDERCILKMSEDRLGEIDVVTCMKLFDDFHPEFWSPKSKVILVKRATFRIAK